LTNIVSGTFNKSVYCGLIQRKAFTLRYFHHPLTDGFDWWFLEFEVVALIDQRLQFTVLAVVANADDWRF
jgi:hypothetical protein